MQGGWCPSQQLQDNTETKVNLDSSINLPAMLLGCERKPEQLEETHTYTGRAHKLIIHSTKMINIKYCNQMPKLLSLQAQQTK